PSSGLLLPRAECSAVPAGAKALLGGCLDARDRAAVGLARLQVDAHPQVIAAWDASAAALRAVMTVAEMERLAEGVGRSVARALDVLAQVVPISTEAPLRPVVMELLLLVRPELQVLSQPEPAEERGVQEQLAQVAVC